MIAAFVERYKGGWLLQRHGYLTPVRAREKLSRTLTLREEIKGIMWSLFDRFYKAMTRCRSFEALIHGLIDPQ